jgi:hypothetical protein
VQSVTDRAIGTDLIRGVRPDQQLVKVCIISFFQIQYLISDHPVYTVNLPK